MKTKSITIISILSITAALFLTSCGPPTRRGRIVEFTCNQKILLFNYANYEASAAGTNGILPTYLSGPSLFLVMHPEPCDASYLYLYLPEDGNQIDLHIEGDLLYVNGMTHSVTLEKGKPRNFAEWYASTDKNELKTIRLILTEGGFEKELDEILSINPDVTIWIEEDETSAHTKGKSLLFTGFFSTNDVINQQAILNQDLTGTRILMLDDSSTETLEAISKKDIPNLHRLILPPSPGWDKLLDAFPHVKAITLIDIDTVPDLGKLQELEELHLVSDAENITFDLTQLPNPKALRFFSVGEKGNVVGSELLTNLEYLDPGEVKFSDKDLMSLISNHPNLVFLDLIDAEIDSLDPLRNAKNIEGLMLGKFSKDALPDFTPLGELKHLRYIGLPNKMDNPDIYEEILDTCPQVIIYYHDKFCLGSGWLVAFLPILLILLLFKRHQVKGRKGAR